jgi:hypothetical protein
VISEGNAGVLGTTVIPSAAAHPIMPLNFLSASASGPEGDMWSQSLCSQILYSRFQVLTAASMMFRIVFWDVLPCKIIVDRRFRDVYCLRHQG